MHVLQRRTRLHSASWPHGTSTVCTGRSKHTCAGTERAQPLAVAEPKGNRPQIAMVTGICASRKTATTHAIRKSNGARYPAK